MNLTFKQYIMETTQGDLGDFIISEYETGKLTYAEAKKKLMDKDLSVYVHELNMADELKKDDGTTLH